MNSSATGPVETAEQLVRQLSKPAKILVMVSGGSDSLGLLIALKQAISLDANTDVTLHAVTVDHQLRPESAAEAQRVADMCARIAVPHVTCRWDDEKPTSGISEAARLARYQLVAKVADEIGATVIVTGHTLDDQLETRMMRAARSTRTENAGLAGMAERTLYARSHWLFRPFLNVRRRDIRSFLQAQGLDWIDDPSNEDRKYERVRARQSLTLQSDTSIDMLAGEKRRVLSEAAARLLKQFGHGEGRGVIWLDDDALDGKSDVLRHALSAVSAVLGGRQYLAAADSMDRLLAFIAEDRPGRMTVSRTVFDRRRDGLFMYRENRNVPSVLIAPGETSVWDGRFRLSNNTAGPMTIMANGDKNADLAQRIFPDVPAGVAKRAFASMPDIFANRDETILLCPVLMPYDLFLPDFDLELACQIAILMDCAAVPQPPVLN
ncbi:tRNA lysidine(34) synthetase TilS [Agrobacterium pusense]|uniref:tRNA lysidine(34) synthetase TilS n=1 Tax=Agrobacterium pusense TaxID=648995 RepID=UPI0028AFFD43|nr:tRNA lysidine(34) synthetase TilS [Agrobacterium pusense]